MSDTSTDAAARNVLTHQKFYKLCEYVKTMPIAAGDTYTGLARRASEALGMQISPYSMQTAMTTTSRALLPPVTQATVQDQIATIAVEIERLQGAIGMTPSPEFLRCFPRQEKLALGGEG